MGLPAEVIPFTRPFLAPESVERLAAVLGSDHAHGDGPFTRSATEKLRSILGGGDVLLTTSGTHALEMASRLLDLQPGDEVVRAELHVLVGGHGRRHDGSAHRVRRHRPRHGQPRSRPGGRGDHPEHARGLGDALRRRAGRHGRRPRADEAARHPGDRGQCARARRAGGRHRCAGPHRRPRRAELPRHEEHPLGRGRRAHHQRRPPRGARRDHAREGHEPGAVRARRDRQVQLGRLGLELPARASSTPPCSTPSSRSSSRSSRPGTRRGTGTRRSWRGGPTSSA